MPAVDLTVLNNRLQSLSLYRNNPETYVSKLEDLLSMYSSKKIQLGENIPLQTLLPRLNIPNLVLEKVNLKGLLNPFQNWLILTVLNLQACIQNSLLAGLLKSQRQIYMKKGADTWLMIGLYLMKHSH